jgi:ubiquinone/menaquinone biosynthesis C-methylase UbiE
MSFHQFFLKIYDRAAKRMCLDCAEFIKEGDKILDLGCGSGIVAKNFQDFFKTEILGVDIEDKRIFPIPLQLIDGKLLPFDDLKFDVILISYVLHHTKDPEKLLLESKRVGKRIIIFEDLPEGVFSKLRCSFHEKSYNLLFQRKNQKFTFKTEKEWKDLFRKLRLKVVSQKRISGLFKWLDPGEKTLFVLESV